MERDIAFKTAAGAVIIKTINDMGGGVDGYYFIGKRQGEGEIHETFDIPYYRNPEEEWKTLSKIGKDNVRTNGWGKTRTLEEVIVYSFDYLAFTEEDAVKLRSFLKEKQDALRVDFEDGLMNSENFDPGVLRLPFKVIQNVKTILRVWELKDDIVSDREKQYGAWVPPED